MLSDFGQPLGSIAQFAYVVRDMEGEMLRYAERLRLGPWFVRGPFQPPEGLYRGQPTRRRSRSRTRSRAMRWSS